MKLNKSFCNGTMLIIFSLVFLYYFNAIPVAILFFSLGILNILNGIFELKEYYDNKLYFTLVALLLIFSLILTYFQTSPYILKIKLMLLLLAITVTIISTAYISSKNLKIFEESKLKAK